MTRVAKLNTDTQLETPMKIVEEYSDGSRTIMHEVGDRVRVTEIDQGSEWLITVGDLATVVGINDNGGRCEQNSITHLEIRTDEMVKGNWGRHSVPPWFIEEVK